MAELETLDLRRLRAFHLVAKHGTLRIAANRLKQSIPSVSGKIHKLESELGFALFEHLPNKLVLTPSGDRFLREVESIFERVEQTLANLNSTAPVSRLTISVGSDSAWYYAPKVRNFLNRYPNVAMNLRVYRAAEAIAALNQGELNLSFGIFPEVPKGIERVVIVETTLALAYNVNEVGHRRRPLRIADLAGQRIILPPRSHLMHTLIARSAPGVLDDAATVLEVPTCETAVNFVETGAGVAFVHTLCMERHPSRFVKTSDLGPRAGKVALCAAFRKGALRDPLVRTLFEEVCLPNAT